MEELTSTPKTSKENSPTVAEQYVSFKVAKLNFGVEIGAVKEIIRYQPLTDVPLAPKVVSGLVNLRGQVITAIDMRKLLSLENFAPDARPTNIIVKAEDEYISLLVDSIGDVIQVEPDTFEPVPSILQPRVGNLLNGLIKRDGKTLLALNPASCLTFQGS